MSLRNRYVIARVKYLDMNMTQLKAVLALNRQTKGGTKSDLVDKCADGEARGAIPYCPICNSGVTPEVQYSTVQYSTVRRSVSLYDLSHVLSQNECLSHGVRFVTAVEE